MNTRKPLKAVSIAVVQESVVPRRWENSTLRWVIDTRGDAGLIELMFLIDAVVQPTASEIAAADPERTAADVVREAAQAAGLADAGADPVDLVTATARMAHALVTEVRPGIVWTDVQNRLLGPRCTLSAATVRLSALTIIREAMPGARRDPIAWLHSAGGDPAVEAVTARLIEVVRDFVGQVGKQGVLMEALGRIQDLAAREPLIAGRVNSVDMDTRCAVAAGIERAQMPARLVADTIGETEMAGAAWYAGLIGYTVLAGLTGSRDEMEEVLTATEWDALHGMTAI